MNSVVNAQYMPPKSQKGFTFIELMVTMVILAIIASIAAPSFQSMIASYRMKKAATSLAGVFYQARSQALKLGAVPVSFDSDYKHWQVGYSNNTSTAKAQAIFDVNMSDNITVSSTSSPSSPMVFYKTGRTDFNGQHVFKICTSGATGLQSYEVILYASGSNKVQRSGVC